MDHEHATDGRRTGGGGRIALAVFLGVAAFFLLAEHRAHLYGVLPYLLLLACPLMHLLHHHGHGGHARHPRERSGGTTWGGEGAP